MKRALIVLLSLAVAGGLFAQVSFSGSVLGGVEVAIQDDTTFSAYHTDSGVGYRFELNANYTNDDGNAGIFARLRYNGAIDGGTPAHVWFKPTDTLWLYGGRIDANRWGTFGGFDSGGDVGSPIGVHLRLDPVPGLSLGAGVAPNGGEVADASYRFGLRYTSSGVFDAAANLNYNGSTEVTNVNAGVNILALSGIGLTRLAVDVAANDITDLAWIGVGPRIGFSVAGLSGEVRSQIYLPMNDDNELDTAVQVFGQYPIGSVTARLGVGFELKGSFKSPTGSFDPREWDALQKSITTGTDPMVVVYPSLAFNIGGGSITAAYSLQTLLADEATTRHAIYLAFNRGF